MSIRSERDLYNPIAASAETAGWWLWHPSDLSAGKKPVDLIGWTGKGRAVAVEVKIANDPNSAIKKLLPHQRACLSSLARANGLPFVASYDGELLTLALLALRYDELIELAHFPYRYYSKTNSFGDWSKIEP